MTANLNLTDLAGVIHLHSAYSFDGRAPVSEIIAAANKCDLDFLLLTDHGTLRARADGWEGWHDGTLVIVGEEIAPRFNHLLVFGLGKSIMSAVDPQEIHPQAYINRTQAMGGISFIAHPDHEGTVLFHVKQYPWTDWSVTGYTGMGLWDFMTDWQNSLTGYVRAILSYLFPALFLCGPSPITLARWDGLTQECRVVGIGELDNHDSLVRIGGMDLAVFPFAKVFRMIRTHILTTGPLSGNNSADIATILEALRNGRAYVALDHYRSSSGFSLRLTEEGREATMGDQFILHRSADLRVSVPYTALIRIVRNGAVIHREIGNDISIPVREPGVYRIEAGLKVFGRHRPWIFSNPIYVAKASTARPAPEPSPQR
ncbi:MAG: CehA/McbA family metallohydrolase [Syntrophales bacterium]